MCKNVQKCAKTCFSSTYLPKNVHLKVSFTEKRAKTCKKRAKTCKNVQKRASQMFLDPIQKRALSRSVHLEAVYLEALLYHSRLNPECNTERGFIDSLSIALGCTAAFISCCLYILNPLFKDNKRFLCGFFF